MTPEQIDRLIRALETIAAKMPSPPIGAWPYMSPHTAPAAPQFPQFYPAVTPRPDCGCPLHGVCMNVSCPRALRSVGAAMPTLSDATQQYHFQSDGVSSAIGATQE